VAGLHFIVKKISLLQNYPWEMRVFKETWQFEITPLADVMEIYVCTSLQTFRCMFIPDGFHKLIGLQREPIFEPIFGSFPFLVFLGPLIMLTNSALQLVSCPGLLRVPQKMA